MESIDLTAIVVSLIGVIVPAVVLYLKTQLNRIETWVAETENLDDDRIYRAVMNALAVKDEEDAQRRLEEF